MKPKTENEILAFDLIVRPAALRAGLLRCFVDETWKDGKPIYMPKTTIPALRCSVNSAAITANAVIVRDCISELRKEVAALKIGATVPYLHTTFSSTHKHKLVFYFPTSKLEQFKPKKQS